MTPLKIIMLVGPPLKIVDMVHTRRWIGEENVQEGYIGACAGGLYWSKSNTVLLLANT